MFSKWSDSSGMQFAVPLKNASSIEYGSGGGFRILRGIGGVCSGLKGG